jgi:hypothetical protein
VTTALRAMEAGSASGGPPRACLIVLDAGQFSTRCRRCRWRSPSNPALTDAQTAFLTHVCPPARSTIGRERQRCQAPCGSARTTSQVGRMRPASPQQRGVRATS